MRFFKCACSAICLFLATPPARAQNFQDSYRQSSSGFIVQAGSLFQNYRYALEFRVPVRVVGEHAARGNFFEVTLESTDDRSLFIYLTSFRIRREAGVKDLAARVYGPCRLPEIPADSEFRLDTSCAGKIELNDLERHITLLRRGDLLHLLVVSARTEDAGLAREVVGSVAIHRGFCFEDKICPYR